jgi:CheY-like chemotaxis protein
MIVTNICESSHPKEDREVLNSPPQDNWSSLKGLQVLVIDDNLDALELTKIILEGYEVEVLLANSASEGFRIFSQLKPDILICDITMPVEDGYSLIRKIRTLEVEQGGEIPAIALTASVRDEERILSLEAGFQIHLAKPFEIDNLIAAVAQLTRP